MGSAPLERYQYHNFLDILNSGPIQCRNTRKVSIQKGPTGKLGIKLRVLIVSHLPETFCIITQVKPECQFLNNSQLNVLERVIKVQDYDITKLSEKSVFELLDLIENPIVILSVCEVSQNKRTRSQLSSSTGSSSSMEVMKKVKDMRKSLIKSNSVDSDKKEPSEHDSLLAGEQRLSGSQLDQFNTCGNYEDNRVNSMPVMSDTFIIEQEKFPSLPVGMQSCKECKNNNCGGGTSHVVPIIPPHKGPAPCHSWAKPVTFQGNYDDLFKYPHRVKWDCSTKVVILHTSSQGKFGFSYKVMEFKSNADDWYTLVKHVTPDGPANGKLMVGDWIRSINGQALASPNEALSLEKRLENLKEVRIVLQRPEGMLPKFHKSFQTSQRSESDSLPQSSPISSPTIYHDITGHPVRSNVPLPGSWSPSSSLGCKKSDIYHRQTSAMSYNSASSKQSSGSTELRIPHKVDIKPKSSSIGQSYRPDPKVDIFSVAKRPASPDARVEQVQIFVPGLQSSGSESVSNEDIQMRVKLPKVRIFVCGTMSGQLSQLLLPEFLLPSENTLRLNDRVRCTMTMEKSGKVSFEPWSQYDYLLQQGQSIHSSNDSLNHCDITNVGIEKIELNTLTHGAVNSEIFIIHDEKFFHHCCQYLFTRTSIFLLTFDADKMLKSASCEIHRLQNLIHTIRGSVGYECQIVTFGLLGTDQSELGSSPVSVDEVQTLFYTSYGYQIMKYNVPQHPYVFQTNQNNKPLADIQSIVWKSICDIQEKQQVLLVSMAMIHQLEQQRQHDISYISEEEFTVLFQETVPGADFGTRQVVWTQLQEFGEILSAKAAPLPLSSISQLDKLLLINPDILLDEIVQLQTVSPRVIQSNEGIKQIWVRLIASGNISEKDWSEILPHSDFLASSVNRLDLDKRLILLQAFGLIFKQYTSEDHQFFIPCFIAVEGPSSWEKPENIAGRLYFQLQGNPPHISSMVYFLLVFKLNNASDTKDVVVYNSSTSTLHHLGYEITLIHEKLKDRIQIQLNRAEKSARLHATLDWLSEVCQATLGSDMKYVLGPACPLQEKCSFSQHTRHNSGELHVIDLTEGLPILCGNIKVDNQVKIWMKPAKKHQQTSLEPVHHNSETGSNESFKSMEPPLPSHMYIKSLPYNVFRDVCLLLQLDVMKDWRCLAGLLGFSMEQVQLYESQPEPAKNLLIDLDQSRRMTVHELVEFLKKPEMMRLDIVEKLTPCLNQV